MLKWRRIFSLRNRALLMVGLPLLSLLAAFTPMFTGSVSAITPEDILNRARAWSVLNAVIDQRQSMRQNISNEDVDACKIFNGDGSYVYVGAHVTGDPDGGDQEWDEVSENSAFLNGGLASVGIDRGCRGLLEAIGYTSNGNGLQRPGDFGDRLSQRIRDALDPNAFLGRNIGDGDPGPAISYAMLYYNLTRVCGWQFRNSYTNNSDPTFKSRNDEARVNGWSGDNRDRHYHTYTYEEGKAGENTYFKSGGREDDVRVGSKSGFAPSGSNDATLDCGDNNADTFGAKLGDNHRFADDYYAMIKPGSDFTPGTCADRYPIGSMVGAEGARQQARLDACDEGFRNKNNPAYCAKFTDTEQRQACEYGQRTATGGKEATTPPPGTGNNGGTEESKPTCIVDGVGWIICPVVTFLAKITDQAYKIVSGLLEIQPLKVNGDPGLYTAWSIMRNFANVAFVIVFLVIIFSQITGAGISNYGIKKMLPRLIIAAVLVNVSYWICAIAVDLSNIAGASIYSLLTGVQEDVALAGPNSGIFASGQGWAGVAGLVLAGGLATATLLYVTLAAMLPILIAILATILSVFLALILRQALVIVLIVLSPLAFVAYLLPNTESLYKGWKSLGQILLLMYPIVGLLFGGSALASTVIMTSSEEWYIQMAGAATAIIPLAAVPTLVTKFNSVAGRLGLPGMGFRLNGMKKKAEDYRDYRKNVAKDRRFERAAGDRGIGKLASGIGPDGSRRRRVAQWLAGSGVTAGQNRELKYQNAERAAKEGAQSYVANRIRGEVDRDLAAGGMGVSAYAQKIAGPSGDVSKVTASAIEASVKEFVGAVNAEKATMSRMDTGELFKILTNTANSEERRAAAAGQITKIGSDKDIHRALNYVGGYETDPKTGAVTGARTDMAADKHTTSLQQQLASDLGGRKPTSLSNSEMSNLNKGTYGGTFDEKVLGRLIGGKYSAEKLASTPTDELDKIMEVIGKNAATIKANAAANPADANAQAARASLAALEKDINAYRANTLVKQPSHDVADRMDSIHGLL